MAALARAPFPGVQYPDYPACLPNYIRNLADSARRKRDTTLASLTTSAAIAKRRVWVRETLLKTIGDFPAKTELRARTVHSVERDGYRLEKVVYESRPGFSVTANLYIPSSGHTPFPGVLFQMGHGLNGKAYDSYQCACQGLVKLGFLVLAFDPMGQGERVYYPDAGGIDSKFHDADLEHTVPGRQMLLVGTTCTQFQLWDAIRSLDYLVAHPLVNPKRIASAGQSGGATLTMLLAAVDDRLHCAAEFSGNTENFACPDFLSPGSTDDAEQNLIGSGPLGFDRWDLLYPFAPKPMLVSISDKDSFGTYSPNYVKNSWLEYERLSAVYKVLGAEKNLVWMDTPLPHGLSYDSRIQLYNWLRLHLQDQSEPITEEPPVAPETDQHLWVTESGNVIRSLGGETPFTLTKKLYQEAKEHPASVSLTDLLKVERPPQQRPTVLRKVDSIGRASIEAIDIRSVADVHIPAWLFRSQKSSGHSPMVVILNPSGRNAIWHEDQLCLALAKRGITVCAADVRGIGDLSPQVSAGAPGYAISHQKQENYAWASLILGRPLVGQRVTDILAVVASLQKCGVRGQAITVAARGELTIPALFAAALEPSIGSLYLAGGLCSYAALVESEDYSHPFANFVPGLLLHTDLPQVVAGLAPRNILMEGLIDGQGTRLPLSAAQSLFQAALSRRHLTLRESVNWTADSLAQFLTSAP